MKLVVGLGNPGREYAATRHNAGAWWVARLAEQLRVGVDTLFRVNTNSCFCSCGKGIEALIIEGLVMSEHAVDGMQQFTHDSAYSLQRSLAVADQMLEEAPHVWIMFLGGQGW